MDSDSDYDYGWIGSSRNKRHRTRWPSYNAPASRGNSPNRHPEGPLPDLSKYGEGKQEKKKKRQGVIWGESSSDDDYEDGHYSDSDAAADESKEEEEAAKDSDSDAEGTKHSAPASDSEEKKEDDSDSDVDGNKGEAHTDKEDSGKKKEKKKEEPEDDGSFEVQPLWSRKTKKEESKEEVEMASSEAANETASTSAPPPPPPPATHSDRAEEFYKDYVAKHGTIDSSKALGALTSASHSKIRELYPGSHASSEEYSQFYRKVQQMGKDALTLHTNEKLQQAEQQLATHGAHNATISIMLQELPTLKAFRDKSLEEQSHSYHADHVAFNDEWRRMLWNRLPKEDQTKEMYERVQTLADDVFREAVKVGQYRTSHRAYKPKRAEHTGYSDTEAEGQADEKPGSRNALKAFRGSLSAKKKKPVREGLSRGSKADEDNDEVVSADEVEQKPKKPHRQTKTDNESGSDSDAEVTKVRRGKTLRASTSKGHAGSVSSDDNMAKHLSRAEQDELDDSLDDEDFQDTVIGGSEEEKSDDNFQSLMQEFDDVKELGEQSRMYASSNGQSSAKDVRRRIMALERLDHVLKTDWHSAGGKPYTKISGVAFNSDNTFRKGAGKVPYLGANGLKHRIEMRLNQLRSLLPHSRSGTSTGQATPKKKGGPPVVTPPKAPKPTKRSAARSATANKRTPKKK